MTVNVSGAGGQERAAWHPSTVLVMRALDQNADELRSL